MPKPQQPTTHSSPLLDEKPVECLMSVTPEVAPLTPHPALTAGELQAHPTCYKALPGCPTRHQWKGHEEGFLAATAISS